MKSRNLSMQKIDKVIEFRNICGERIYLGFSSDALGSTGHYRCNRDDQEKMRVAKESPDGGKIWVGEVFTHHSQSQAESVYASAISHIDLITTEYSDKYGEIKLAETPEDVDLITWPE